MKSERSKREKLPQRKTRLRRTPEEARQVILDAAEKVFSTHLPDVVGLKDVAREAGVSHALITHYFGTYDALVEATLERRFHQMRDELVPVLIDLVQSNADVRAMLTAHRQAIQRLASNPATLRLAVWALLSGRVDADDFFPSRMQGLKMLADALEARSTASRVDIEFLLVASFAMATTWTFAGKALLGALGRKPTKDVTDAFEERTACMIEQFLASAQKQRD